MDVDPQDMGREYDKMLMSWMKDGVPTGEFDKDSVERMRKPGPGEAKIIGERLKFLDVGPTPPGGNIPFNPADRPIPDSFIMPPLSMDDDPATA